MTPCDVIYSLNEMSYSNNFSTKKKPSDYALSFLYVMNAFWQYPHRALVTRYLSTPNMSFAFWQGFFITFFQNAK